MTIITRVFHQQTIYFSISFMDWYCSVLSVHFEVSQERALQGVDKF